MKNVIFIVTLCLTIAMQSFGQTMFRCETDTAEIKAYGYFSNAEMTCDCALLIMTYDNKSDKIKHELYHDCTKSTTDKTPYFYTFIGKSTQTTVTCYDSISFDFVTLCKGNDKIYVKMTNRDGDRLVSVAVFRLSDCKRFGSCE